MRAVTAAGELLGHPVPLDVLLRAGRGLAEVADEAANHGRLPLSLVAARPDARLLTLKEARQHAGRAQRRKVVEGHLHRSGIRGGLPVEPSCRQNGSGQMA